MQKTTTKEIWKDFSFRVPPSFEDETVLTYTRRGSGLPVSLTLAMDHLTQRHNFERYLASQVESLKQNLVCYHLVSRRDRVVAGMRTAVLEHSTRSSEGRSLRQLQAYVESDGRILIVTASASADDDAALDAAFEEVLSTLAHGGEQGDV